MKSTLISCLLLLFFSSLASAQLSIPVQEGPLDMSRGSQNALYITLKKVDQNDLEKKWTKYIKGYKGDKTKKNKKTKEIFSDNMKLDKISRNTVDVYAISKPMSDSILFVVWFDLGGAYLNSDMHPEAVKEAKLLMQDFGLSVSKALVEEMLGAEEKKLDKLNGDMKGLAKDKKNYEDDIAKYEKLIEEAKNKISQNDKAQGAKEQEIASQKEVVESIRKKLKEME